MLEQGGEKAQKDVLVQNELMANGAKLIVPAMLTMLTGTFTYPIATRIARSWPFRLRGFWAINLSCAPFLAFIHVHIFGTSHAYFRIKITEKEFERNQSQLKHLDNRKLYKNYYDLKSSLVRLKAPKPTHGKVDLQEDITQLIK